MVGDVLFPPEEASYDFATRHPAIHACLGRVRALPGWQAPYDLLPGQRLPRYV
ncbi:hypothetical protein [Bradyrhizobium sp. 2TAF24]|uniref:hypothetical protein n=1 Tax=Bradyrhizobium sp. 2TAF24 TaxID=3233011 RepID=UPI003F90B52C